MNQRAPSATVRLLERLPVVGGVVAIACAAIVLAGWYTGNEVLKSLIPGVTPSRQPSAVALAAGGVALLATRFPRSLVARTLTVLAGLVPLLIGLIATGVYGPLERTIFEDLLHPGGLARGHTAEAHIAINTAVALLSIGISLVLVGIRPARGRRLTQYFAALSLFIAFLAFVGYAFGVAGLYRPTSSLGMGMWTVLGLHALAAGALFARTDVGFPALLMETGPSGRLARRLMPAAVAVPFIVPWLVDRATRGGYLGADLSPSVVTVLIVVALIWIILRSARVVQVADRERSLVVAREQHEREVAQQALIAAETASSAKSDFLAVMSHELRTPLTAIIGYEELLADGITGPVNHHQGQQLSRIKASAHHLLGLIDEILTFSRLEAGRETVRKELVEANSVVRESADLVAPLAIEKKLEFTVNLLESPRLLRTDPVKMKQIVVNLLSNAVKFTAHGGVTVTTAIQNDQLVIRVHDTGPGIPPENVERVFEPFWQAEQSATRRAGGTGLGLTVTRRLARLMGGDVAVESMLGEGTVFTATLPGVVPLSPSDVFGVSGAVQPRV